MSDLFVYDRNQRQRTLTTILVTVMIATAIFAAINQFLYHSQKAAAVFLATAILCLPALWLNWRGYFLAARLATAGLVLAAAHFNLVDGAGLQDPGIAAYPIIIIVGGLIFGKRAVPFFAGINILSLLGVIIAQATYTVEDFLRLVIISILLLAAAVTTGAIMNNMEKHVARIKQSEASLRLAFEQTQAQARQVHQIIETVPEGVLLLTADGRIALANEMAGRFLQVLAPGAGPEHPLTHLGAMNLAQVLASPEAGGWQEIQVAEPAAIFEAAARPVAGSSDTAQDWVVVLRDVTEQRRQLTAIHEQERMATVGQLAAGIAHDFRNILTVISTYSQILRVRPDSPKQEQYLTVVQRQTQDAARLIEQILDFSRRSVIERQVTDLVDLVENLITLLQRTMPSNINLIFEHDSQPYYLLADKTRLQQALMNLAVNARDAMPNGGRLQFTLTAAEGDDAAPADTGTDDWIRLEVTDSGLGIMAADLPHIFEPFYTRKTVGTGTGLGLAQVMGIVKQHSGEITVQSQLGQGTTFRLYFPAVAAVPPAPTGRDEEMFGFAGAINILLVEDNPLARKSAQEMFELLGCRVITASNGKEALAIFDQQQQDFHLVVSDIVMPEMGGLELYQKLQEIAPDLKMLILTGYPLHDSTRTLLEQEMVAWLEKPYEIGTVARKINDILPR